MSTYFYYQKEGKESAWTLGLASNREAIIDDVLPAFVTVLDVSIAIDEFTTAEDIEKARYSGGFYADFDNDDLEECIERFQEFLANLEALRVDLDDVLLYATGGRGFHVEIPQGVFIERVVKQGYQYLPQIYKEMAHDNRLYVDSLDLRVYSAKRGRMWRCDGVQRDNGKYKVYITPDQARGMTVDLYDRVTSEPVPPPVFREVKYSPDLGVMFSQAKDRVERKFKDRKRSNGNKALIEKWKGEVPDTLKAIMSGENLAENAGFQSIATQLAISANALGQSEEDFLAECQGLIEEHRGDSTRYGTPEKRRAELSRMYRYMHGNVCYEFSAGAIKTLLAPGTPTPDLDGGFESEVQYDEEGNPIEIEDSPSSITVGVKVNKMGIWKLDNDKQLVLGCSLGMDNYSQLIDGGTEEVIGYEMDAYLDGKPLGRKFITMEMMTSSHNFIKFTQPFSASMQLTDAQVRALPDILRKRTDVTNAKTYTVKREGVDMIRLPGGSGDEWDMIFAHPEGVESARGINYRLRPQYGNTPALNSDLFKSPSLAQLETKDREKAKEFFRKFFYLNTVDTVAKTFGWMLAAFLSQSIRREYNEFPLLQVYGTAGSGKSAYMTLMDHLHFYKRPPHILAADGLTPFMLEQSLMSSASIPVILDEVKPREMRRQSVQKLKQMLRNNFNGNAGGKGYINRDTGSSNMTVTRTANECPLVFIGEAIEAQSAIMDRCIIVTMSPEGRKGKSKDFRDCQEDRHFLSALGKSCVEMVMKMNMDWLKQKRKAFLDALYPKLGDRADKAERPIKNYATCLTGLEFGRVVMNEVFGGEFDAEFSRLQQAILDQVDNIVPHNMSEASKVLNTLAYMTTISDSHALEYGLDYEVGNHHGIECLDLVLRNAYNKYARFQRARGEELLFDTEDAFISAMHTHPAVVDRMCVDKMGTLKLMPSTKVFRFRLDTLYDQERVDEFKEIPNPNTRQ